MIKKLRGLRGLGHGLGHGLGYGALCALALSSAAAQGLPPQPPPPVPPAAVAQPSPPPTPPQAAPPGQTAPPAQAASSPICARLEGQLAGVNAGANDPARADQIKRAEDAVAQQQADLDRTTAQAHRSGCESEGFFALFSGLSPQCGPLTSKIQQMRGNLDHMMSDLEQLKSGSADQDGQRRALIGLLAQNNCGSQYAAAAVTSGPRGFFDALFGGGTIVNPGGDGAPSGTYQTICVRTCDGFYFPISYTAVPGRFPEDERACQRLCPATEAALYMFHNPGEDVNQAVSTAGLSYTALPTAFLYRKQVVAGCSCRRPGQSWADALKNADDSSTIQSGDIVVTDQKAKALSQPPQSAPAKPGATPSPAPPAATDASDAKPDSAKADTKADAKRTVRVVGPPFMSATPH
jgi:hypothetical protein